MNTPKLLAIQSSRRAVGVAVFTDTRLEFVQVRHLASSHTKAEDTAVEFIQWVLSRFEIDHAALEQLADASKTRRAELGRIIVRVLREEAIPIWNVRAEEMFSAFGIPPVKTREDVRHVAIGFWPILKYEHDNAATEAAAIGIYVQTERLFQH